MGIDKVTPASAWDCASCTEETPLTTGIFPEYSQRHECSGFDPAASAYWEAYSQSHLS